MAKKSSKSTGNKTIPTKANVEKFIAGIEHDGRREDAGTLLQLFTEITSQKPVMWGPSIVGFGSYHYVYESGREGDMPITGFSPRKAKMVVYIMPGFDDYKDELSRLGKHKTGSSCLYLGRLSGIDLEVLGSLVRKSCKHVRKKHKTNC